MSETTDTGPATAELAARQDAVEGKLDQILSVLGKQPAAKDPAADQQDPPTSVAEEIRAQLDERDRKAAADKAAADGDAWRKGVDEKLAGMAEQAPEPPVRRIEKIMGWR